MSFPGLATAAGVVSVPQTTQLQPTSVLSLEAWIRFPAAPANHEFVAAYGNAVGTPPYGFYFSPDGQIHADFALTGGRVDVVSPRELRPNTTYYVAVTFDGTTARLYINGAQVASKPGSGNFAYQSGYGFTIGNDTRLNYPSFTGTIDEVAVYAGKALTAAQIADHYAAGTLDNSYVDWNGFGYDLQRTGYNPNEATLSSTNVAGGLTKIWSTNLGGAIAAQPILATRVSINGKSTDVLYIGAENNVFYAINADTGAVLWQNATFGSPEQTNCSDLPGDTFGITSTATFDRSAGVVYVADGNGNVHALSMSTGTELWRTNVLYDPNTNAVVGSPAQDYIYGALTFNPSNGMLYAITASICDTPPWFGRIVAINPGTQSVVAAFFPGRTSSGKSGTAYCGGGIWGMGGPSIDPTTNDVFVATGNMDTGTRGGCIGDTGGSTHPYGDSVVQLDSQLNLISSQAATVNGTPVKGDLDYGATPMLYRTSSCSVEQTSAKNKDGYIYTYGVGAGLTFEQQIQVGVTTTDGDSIGVPAFDPTTGLVYVGNPKATGEYAYGLNAFAQSAGSCSGLTLQWQASVGGANATTSDNQAPSVANGVVYFTDGIGNQLWAFNDATGTTLWQSGTAIGAPCRLYGACGVFGAPTVDKYVFVGSFNHSLYAFGISPGLPARRPSPKRLF